MTTIHPKTWHAEPAKKLPELSSFGGFRFNGQNCRTHILFGSWENLASLSQSGSHDSSSRCSIHQPTFLGALTAGPGGGPVG
eukprot:scaffold211828_cov13-Tisochrysis_lutea.AAC.1